MHGATATASRLANPTATGFGLLAVAGIATALGVASALEPRVAIVMAAAVCVPLLLWADPKIGFAWFAFSLAINTDVLAAPVHVSLPQLFLLTLVVGLMLRWRAGVRRRLGLWGAGGLLFAAATLPSLLRAVHPSAAVIGIVEMVILGVTLFVVARWLIRHPAYARDIIPPLVVGAALTAIPALIQVAFGIGPSAFRAGDVMRAYATFSEPNTYGVYLAGTLPLAIMLAISRRSVGYAIAAAAIALALGLTGSRGAWIGAFAGLLVFALTVFRLRLRTVLTISAFAAGLAVLVLALPRELLLARFDLADWSVQQRMLVLLSAVDGIARSPFVGHGAGSLAVLLGALGRQGLVDDVTMAHNLFLDVWFQFGIVPVLLLVFMATAFAIAAVRAARLTRDLGIASLLASATAMFGSAMFGTLFIRGIQEMFVLIIAMTAALVIQQRTKPAGAHA
jgi:hypothetical protein